ncbi:RdgB/HAM1 family non-canonical purine NTP pyrophosphatase [Bifidobacterium sp. 82T24]|uniref:RdgB/HAM1 family non-canonical purine NTP pyrophosphatase n=1 Tax=Bifidobacterium pluvialisilvae TaxID=2834436 RepID=UPI001C58017D|nr:RdgB/HAM1 family non-canonical purine NTP pyrophosphatase [Bifidobacterium pluvialisilvae]MBW3087513.1 RdgB/HAM1 family non-canonical purine NTP pyrophosphatase [Bifidobacterium pluvialisilvae]
MKLVVATHNEGKLVEIRRILTEDLGADADRIELVTAGQLGLPDPVEDGVSFEQNALLKARDVVRRTGLPAIADDSGLIVDVLGAAPGILSARWCGRHGDDVANYELLLAQIADIPDRNRTARFRCAAAFVTPEEGQDGAPYSIHNENVELGDMRGVIIRAPRGEHGFGYDPIFVPDDQPARSGEGGMPLTSAEMTAEEKNAISHRSKAIKALTRSIRRALID